MSVRRDEPPPHGAPSELFSTRALLIVLVGVLAGTAAAVKPDLAVPIGVGVAVMALLMVAVEP